MNYREKMRKYIECPQFGSINYGKWGSLNLEQRKLIKRLLDEMDRADEIIKKQFFELNKQNEVLDKIKEYAGELRLFDNESVEFEISTKLFEILEEVNEQTK